MTTSEWKKQVDAFIASLTSENTKKRYRAALVAFSQWHQDSYGERPTLAVLASEDLRDWRVYLHKIRRLAASTVNLHLSAVKSFARYHGHRDLNVETVQSVEKPRSALTEGEVRKLLRKLRGARDIDRRNVAMCYLMVGAGFRVGEVVDLRLDDMVLKRGDSYVIVRYGKGGKERTIGLGPDVRSALRAWLKVRPGKAEADHVFLSRSGQPLQTRDVRRVVSVVAEQAGIEKDVSPHILRHSFATQYVARNQGDLVGLQRILGHRHLVTTERYIGKPTREQVRERMTGIWRLQEPEAVK